MRVFHFVLYGALLFSGKLTQPPPYEVTLSPPKTASARTGEEKLRLAAFKRDQRILKRLKRGDDVINDPLNCLRAEWLAARHLEGGARQSVSMAEDIGNISPTVLQTMKYYKEFFSVLSDIYYLQYQMRKEGKSVPPKLLKNVTDGWNAVRKLDRDYPLARDIKYIGSSCGVTTGA